MKKNNNYINYTLLGLVLLFTSHAYAEVEFNSLSCSKNGTEILFYGGDVPLLNTWSTQAIGQIKKVVNNKLSRIDNNSTMEFSELTLSSAPFMKRMFKEIVKVFEAQGPVSQSDISSFIFDKLNFCKSNKALCTSTQRALKVFSTANSISNLANYLTFAYQLSSRIDLNKKVIIVSHGMGNVQFSPIYGLNPLSLLLGSKIDRYVGHLQVGYSPYLSPFRNNGYYVVSKEDSFFDNIIDTTHNLVARSFPDDDSWNEDFVRTYLSEYVRLERKNVKEGRLDLSTADKMFVEKLEEVAWMLANNDNTCCEGRDGRFYRKDYKTEVTKGFVEKSVSINKRLTLLMDEGSQICGNVELYPLSDNSNEKIVLAKNTNSHSEIIGNGPIKIAGTVFLNGSKILNDNLDDTLTIVGNNSNGIDLADTNIQGAHTISGDVVIDSSNISSTLVGSTNTSVNIWGNMTGGLLPTINADISGNSTVGGFYTMNRDIENVYVQGNPVVSGSGELLSLLNLPYKVNKIENSSLLGIGYVAGNVNNSSVNGYKVSNNVVGVILEPAGSISDNTDVAGAVYLEGATSISDGVFIRGDQTKEAEEYILHITNSNIYNGSSVTHAPRVISTTLNDGHVTDTAFVSGSYLLGHAVAQCDARVIGKTLNGTVASCGYSKKNDLKDNILEKAGSIIQKSINEKIELTNYYMAAKEEVLNKFKK